MPWCLIAAMLIGIGSSVFHPESSRVARMASGGRHGLAQSLFQVGGNTGTALGPLTAALLVAVYGQRSVAWYARVGAAGHCHPVQCRAPGTSIMAWRRMRARHAPHDARPIAAARSSAVGGDPAAADLLQIFLSRQHHQLFHLLSDPYVPCFGAAAQVHLFVFLAAVAVGTFAGGPMGDRFGRKYVIWFSILGMLPFTLMLPYANLFWTGILSVIIGVIMASAFPAIVVYAQELLPGKVGMVSGLFFGFAFGMGGLGAALLGTLADATCITFVYKVCAFLPVIGLLTMFLPNLGARKA